MRVYEGTDMGQSEDKVWAGNQWIITILSSKIFLSYFLTVSIHFDYVL